MGLEVASWAASGPEEFLGTHGKVAGGWMSQMREELSGRLTCVVGLASTRVGQFSWFGDRSRNLRWVGLGDYVPIDMLVSHVKSIETYREQWAYDRNTFWQVLDINIVGLFFWSNSSRNGILNFLPGCVQLLIAFW